MPKVLVAYIGLLLLAMYFSSQVNAQTSSSKEANTTKADAPKSPTTTKSPITTRSSTNTTKGASAIILPNFALSILLPVGLVASLLHFNS